MRKFLRKSSRPLVAMLLGLTVTALVALGYRHGLGAEFEQLSLDLRFRALARAPEYTGGANAAGTSGITHVDIDDGTIEEFGLLPWPRTHYADLIDELHALGARAVLVDIILRDPQRPLLEQPGVTDLYTRVLPAEEAATQPAGPAAVRAAFTDKALAEALARHPRTYLAFLVDFSDGAFPGPPALLEALLTDLTADPAALAERTALPPETVARWVAEARVAAVERKVAALLGGAQDQPPPLEDVIRATVGDAPAGSEPYDRVRRAYLRQRGLDALRERALADAPLAGVREGRLVPPMPLFARSARRVGFVTYDPTGDTTRAVPLLAQADGRLYPQFAFAAALDELASTHGGEVHLVAQPGLLTIQGDAGPLRQIQLDERGAMLVNWTPAMRRWETAFDGIPAGAVLAVAQQRRALADNRDRLRLALLRMAHAKGDHTLDALYAEVDRLQPLLDRQTARWQSAALADPAREPAEREAMDALAERLADVEGRIDRGGQELIEEVRDFYLASPPQPPANREPATAPADPEALTSETWRAWQAYRRDVAVYERLRDALPQATAYLDANAAIEQSIEEARRRLRPHVENRFCLVGATSSGEPDFVATPMHPHTPGVLVHANVLNTLLTGAMIRQADPMLNLGVILACGVLVSLAAAYRPAWQAGLIALLATGGFVAVNAIVVFQEAGVWMAMVAPVVAMVLAYAVVATYRQLTEERQKRAIRAMFSQALSAELVDRLVDDPALMRLGGERRAVSCLFADLAGFTTLSESLGEGQTVALLNTWFDRAGDVIRGRHEGYLNKFLGDGTLALFGAPVIVPDHARRALLAGLDLQAELAALDAWLRKQEHPAAGRLGCRVGITTGVVMVGNCGSSTRLDYTAIGDPVNLASRLEGANKHFGTGVLCDDATWRAGGQDVLARPLGLVAVVGRQEPVRVWQPLTRRAQADAPTREAVDRFTEGVEAFEHGDFRVAAEQFELAQAGFGPADKPTRLFLARCRDAVAAEPFDAVLRLAEK